nr:immunoglobulin heavy chain junction region [Mus musculus]
CARYFDVW